MLRDRDPGLFGRVIGKHPVHFLLRWAAGLHLLNYLIPGLQIPSKKVVWGCFEEVKYLLRRYLEPA